MILNGQGTMDENHNFVMCAHEAHKSQRRSSRQQPLSLWWIKAHLRGQVTLPQNPTSAAGGNMEYLMPNDYCLTRFMASMAGWGSADDDTSDGRGLMDVPELAGISLCPSLGHTKWLKRMIIARNRCFRATTQRQTKRYKKKSYKAMNSISFQWSPLSFPSLVSGGCGSGSRSAEGSSSVVGLYPRGGYFFNLCDWWPWWAYILHGH